MADALSRRTLLSAYSQSSAPIWTAGALAGMRPIGQAAALVGSCRAVPARALAVHTVRKHLEASVR